MSRYDRLRKMYKSWLCSFARRNGETSFIAVESEETDYFKFGNPSLHPECGHES